MSATDIENAMFCYQCEQTIGGTGCTKVGRCMKNPEVAALEDVQMMGVQKLATVAKPIFATLPQEMREKVVWAITEATFMTLTNVSFDGARFRQEIASLQALIEELSARGVEPAPAAPDVAAWTPSIDPKKARIDLRMAVQGKTVVGLQELIAYGMKGLAAYMDHAMRLGVHRPGAEDFMVEAMAFLAQQPTDVGALLAMALRLGENNLATMDGLHEANCHTYGDPTPTEVQWAPFSRQEGKCILVSGHDLLDMYELLEATKDTGIKIYTHGEMLAANGYPGLKKYSHLAGHYGTAWQNQVAEFRDFPGAVLMTTNCVIPRVAEYRERIFTTNLVGVDGVTHITGRGPERFAPLIAAAQAAPGFVGTAPATPDTHRTSLTVGFGLPTVASVADQILAAAGSGALRRIFLVGGCDGFEGSRNYYTDFAAKAPKDTLILTLACGKFKLNHLEMGTIDLGGGVVLPRLLDLGQCNDAHTAVEAVKALAAKAHCGPNELPLSIVLSWFEQKAVCILLSLLHLGLRNIRLGPALPAFLTPEALAVLVEKFNIGPIGASAQADLDAILGPVPAPAAPAAPAPAAATAQAAPAPAAAPAPEAPAAAPAPAPAAAAPAPVADAAPVPAPAPAPAADAAPAPAPVPAPAAAEEKKGKCKDEKCKKEKKDKKDKKEKKDKKDKKEGGEKEKKGCCTIC
ncbi:putative Hydroxylamine reductase [Paratrimastix pyriformis]|uniref:Hydroxylamine reductase n=1 Tax=Paratrimastix pyriformis TaxID=342808 RepID=A0ABQ8U9F8_9EUKA|nr:putative Hydroxylamine reductase [Paratrimastix pyriformis]